MRLPSFEHFAPVRICHVFLRRADDQLRERQPALIEQARFLQGGEIDVLHGRFRTGNQHRLQEPILQVLIAADDHFELTVLTLEQFEKSRQGTLGAVDDLDVDHLAGGWIEHGHQRLIASRRTGDVERHCIAHILEHGSLEGYGQLDLGILACVDADLGDQHVEDDQAHDDIDERRHVGVTGVGRGHFMASHDSYDLKSEIQISNLRFQN